MRIGIHTAQVGPQAGPDQLALVARSAEQIGYSSIWVLDRLPAAIEPREGYGGMPGEPLPPEQRRSLDPFLTLAVTAAHTTNVRIGTSVLVAPWYPPVVLARLLTSLDVLSAGRLTVGLGMGWSTDEFEAAGVDRRTMAARLDEALDVLDAHWSDGPIAHEGPTSRIVPSYNDLRPVQDRPPVLLAAFSPAGFDRIARRADGWNPAGMPVELLAPMWADIRDRAASYGRDPDALQLIARANIKLTDQPIEGDRPSYVGSFEQVAEDLVATRDTGVVDEVILGVIGATDLDQLLDVYARLADVVGLVPAAA
jgi:probable F420-dependent oxidoreductase